MTQTITVALAGNPNSGKTSLFNALTGGNQRVGNYPGVTVERKEGAFTHKGYHVQVVDLPGTYSLSALSFEERVAREHVIQEEPDVVVNVVDSSNLERNLYLTVQFMELGANLVLALNMADEARKMGQRLDLTILSARLGGIPVVETEANRKKGSDALKDAIIQAALQKRLPPDVSFNQDIEMAIEIIQARLKGLDDQPYPPRLLALKLIEEDLEIRAIVQAHHPAPQTVANEAQRQREHLMALGAEDPAVLMAEGRYGFAAGLIKEATLEPPHFDRVTFSDMVDRLVLHRVAGLPIFFGAMYLLFWLTFSLGSLPMGWIEQGMAALSVQVSALWPPDSPSLMRSLLVDGLLGGVGGVMAFLPNILLLFLGLSFLEDTGYMARAAFLSDRMMHRLGLHGRSFIPVMVGIGCTVPAIMACRILENQRDRITTIMVLPLVSCGARLPIYILLISAFFPLGWQAPVLMAVYLFGIIMAAILARVLRKTVLSGEDTPFVMELPPYRLPTIRAMVRHMGSRALMYLHKAATVILVISIIIWAAGVVPQKPSFAVDQAMAAGASLSDEEVKTRRSMEQLEYSLAGRLGHAMEPALKLMGFDWRIATGLIGAFAAKEVFVAQLGVVFSIGQTEGERSEGLRAVLRKSYTPLQGLCLILFALIATPCMATLAITRKETGSWGWAAFQWLGLTALAFALVTALYQVGHLLGLG